MKEMLLKKIQPIAEKFVTELLKTQADIDSQKDELAKEFVKLAKGQAAVKAEDTNNKHYLEGMKDKLNEEKAKQVGLNKQISEEIVKYNKLTSEIKKNEVQSKEYLLAAETEKTMISDSLVRAKDKEVEYSKKIQRIKDDENAIQLKKEDLSIREAALEKKEKALYKLTEEQALRGKELADVSLNLKARETEVKRLIKHYELKTFIKSGDK